MAANAARVAGSCHCGTIRVALETSRPPATIELRACGCAFCTRRAARMVSDPTGRAEIAVAAPKPAPYRFGTGTADFLICPRCGVFAAAMIEDAGRAWVVLNVRGLAMTAFADSPCASVDFDGEQTADRMARRMARWTPAVIRYNNAGEAAPAD